MNLPEFDKTAKCAAWGEQPISYGHKDLVLFADDFNIEVFLDKKQRRVFDDKGHDTGELANAFFAVLTDLNSGETHFARFSSALQDRLDDDYLDGEEVDGNWEWMVTLPLEDCQLTCENYHLADPETQEESDEIGSRYRIIGRPHGKTMMRRDALKALK